MLADQVRIPDEYKHLTASPVYSPIWGRGWLGYYVRGDLVQLWFVYEDGGATEIEYQEIMCYDDRRNGLLWLIFYAEEVLPFVLDPPEGAVVFDIPRAVKSLTETNRKE